MDERLQEMARILRKIEMVWLHVPNMQLMRLLRDNFGDQQGRVTTDMELGIRLDEILATVLTEREVESDIDAG